MYLDNRQDKTFPEIRIYELRSMPICIGDSKQFVDITRLVNNLLKLNEQLQTTKLKTQRQQIQRAINHAEKKIDELIYGLYGLSKKEIDIIENS